MSLINFSFDPWGYVNSFFVDAAVTNYLPPGAASGKQANCGYTVPDNFKSIATISFSIYVEGTGTNRIARQYTFIELLNENDVVAVFSNYYFTSTNIIYLLSYQINGVTKRSFTATVASTAASGMPCSSILAYEYNP